VADLPWIMSTPTPWPYSSPRRAPLPRRTAVDPAWARHPQHLRRPNGQLEEFHYIGALAEALGKSPCSVRRYERESVLPPTPFRHRVCGGPARRLYLRDQIEGIVQIAEEEGIAHGKPANISATNFTARVMKLYATVFGIG